MVARYFRQDHRVTSARVLWPHIVAVKVDQYNISVENQLACTTGDSIHF